MEKFTPLAKSFTLPLAVTTVTNLTSDVGMMRQPENLGLVIGIAFFMILCWSLVMGPIASPLFRTFPFNLVL